MGDDWVRIFAKIPIVSTTSATEDDDTRAAPPLFQGSVYEGATTVVQPQLDPILAEEDDDDDDGSPLYRFAGAVEQAGDDYLTSAQFTLSSSEEDDEEPLPSFASMMKKRSREEPSVVASVKRHRPVEEEDEGDTVAQVKFTGGIVVAEDSDEEEPPSPRVRFVSVVEVSAAVSPVYEEDTEMGVKFSGGIVAAVSPVYEEDTEMGVKFSGGIVAAASDDDSEDEPILAMARATTALGKVIEVMSQSGRSSSRRRQSPLAVSRPSPRSPGRQSPLAMSRPSPRSPGRQSPRPLALPSPRSPSRSRSPLLGRGVRLASVASSGKTVIGGDEELELDDFELFDDDDSPNNDYGEGELEEVRFREPPRTPRVSSGVGKLSLNLTREEFRDRVVKHDQSRSLAKVSRATVSRSITQAGPPEVDRARPHDPTLVFEGCSFTAPLWTKGLNFRYVKPSHPFSKGTAIRDPSGAPETINLSQQNLLGSGGFGGVVDRDSRTVVKFAFNSASLTYPQRCCSMLDEFLIHSRMSHPNVIAFFAGYMMEPDDPGSQPTSVCIMEKGDLGSLGSLLKNVQWKETMADARHTRSLLRSWEADGLRGLEYIHGMGVCHRDIKPDNVLLVTSASGRIVAKLADMGGSTVGVVVGTPRSAPFASPEIYSASIAGYGADIWAWAVTFFKAHTGVHPFAFRVEGQSGQLIHMAGGGRTAVRLRVHGYLGGYSDHRLNTACIQANTMMPTETSVKSPSKGLWDAAHAAENIPETLTTVCQSVFVLYPNHRPSATDLLQYPRYAMETPARDVPRVKTPDNITIQGTALKVRHVIKPVSIGADAIPDKRVWGVSAESYIDEPDPRWLYNWGEVDRSTVETFVPTKAIASGSVLGVDVETLIEKRGFVSIYALGPTLVGCVRGTHPSALPVDEAKRMASVTAAHMRSPLTCVVPIYTVSGSVCGMNPYCSYVTEKCVRVGDVALGSRWAPLDDFARQLIFMCLEFAQAGLRFPYAPLTAAGCTSWVVSRTIGGKTHYYIDAGFSNFPFEKLSTDPSSQKKDIEGLQKMAAMMLGSRMLKCAFTSTSIKHMNVIKDLLSHPIMVGVQPTPKPRWDTDPKKVSGLTLQPRDFNPGVVRYDFGRKGDNFSQ